MAIKNKYVLEFNSKGVKKTKEDVDKLDQSQGKLVKNSTKLKAGLAVAGVAIAALGKHAINTAAQFQTLQTRLNTMYGSVTQGTKAFQSFVKVASTTPFAVKSVVEAGASLKAFGMDAEKNIKGVADLAAFMGVDVVEAAQAMGRAFAGGAGAADVLRERGVLELIKSFKGIEDLTKLTLPEFRTALIDAMEDPQLGISGSTNALAETFEGNMSNMMDAVDRLAAKMGDKLLPAATDVVKGFTGFINSMISSKDAVNQNISAMIGEQTQLNLMVSTITSANTSQKTRVTLIRQLQKEYPDFLKNINAEKVTNEQLKGALLNANTSYEKRIKLLTLEGEASLIRTQMASLQAKQVQETQEYSDAIVQVAGELNHFVGVMNDFNQGNINWAAYFSAIDDVVGNVAIASGEGRDKIEKHFQNMFEGATQKLGEAIDFSEVTGLNEEAIRKFIETSDLFENWRGADIFNDDMQDIIAASLKWDSATNRVILDFNALSQAFKDQEIGANSYLQMFPQLTSALADVQEKMRKVNDEIKEPDEDGIMKPLDIKPLDIVSTAKMPSVLDLLPIGLDSTKAEIDAAMIAIKEKLSTDLISLREELAELNVMDTIAGSTNEREARKNEILQDIEDINEAIKNVTTETVSSTTKSTTFLEKFAAGFKKTVVAIGSDENQVIQDVLDGASALIAAGGQGKEKQIMMQKAMIKANVAKGLIDIWTSPAPNDPLTAAKAVAASAVLIGKASQSNQQLNQALSDLKGGGDQTTAQFAEYGMNQVVDGATPIIAGEAGAELVQITPLEGPNVDGPQGQGQIVITGNVMSKDFVEDELVEQLKESIRQGYDFR